MREGRERNFPVSNRRGGFQGRVSEEGARLGFRKYSDRNRGDFYKRSGRQKEISFLFFNFPVDWKSVDLWRLFKRYGDCTDIYMAKRNLRNGKRFGFIRFKSGRLDWELERKLSSIWIGNFKLHVFKADQRKTKDSKSPVLQDRGRIPEKEAGEFGWRSYAEVVRGSRRVWEANGEDRKKPSPGSAVGRENQEKGNLEGEEIKEDMSFGTWDSDKKHLAVLENSLVGTISSVDNLGAVNKLCNSVIQDCKIKYLGGHRILLVFNKVENSRLILTNKNHGLHHWVKNIEKWSIGDRATERLIWIKISGIPLHGWKEEVFESIAKNWGKVICCRNCNLIEYDNLTGGKVLIRSPLIAPINCLGHIKFGNLLYRVTVKEIEELDECMGTDDLDESEKLLASEYSEEDSSEADKEDEESERWSEVEGEGRRQDMVENHIPQEAGYGDLDEVFGRNDNADGRSGDGREAGENLRRRTDQGGSTTEVAMGMEPGEDEGSLFRNNPGQGEEQLEKDMGLSESRPVENDRFGNVLGPKHGHQGGGPAMDLNGSAIHYSPIKITSQYADGMSEAERPATKEVIDLDNHWEERPKEDPIIGGTEMCNNQMNPARVEKRDSNAKQVQHKSKAKKKEQQCLGRGKVSFHLMKKLARERALKAGDRKGLASTSKAKEGRSKSNASRASISGSQCNSVNSLGNRNSEPSIREFGEMLGMSWSGNQEKGQERTSNCQ
ncbi:hypothetical protein OSB04_un000778 [Centaurea solstitialis]|uniref:RRM domain-containing protein n=1 Tax=Centaurea solstitialis TaxID=347529 RepID=A0AA38SMY7_9ASTR|nr:hypothetical protein OSB04_un000778 [Centaurea solstitialis]